MHVNMKRAISACNLLHMSEPYHLSVERCIIAAVTIVGVSNNSSCCLKSVIYGLYIYAFPVVVNMIIIIIDQIIASAIVGKHTHTRPKRCSPSNKTNRNQNENPRRR